ncbi:MAG: hypothetical protein NTY02_11055 [Acidobacteria bacterium]|nr:hypothetical protein [Acidobacteriota bacterium]
MSLAKYVRPSDQVTGLHVAAGNDFVETVDVLLKNGAVVDGDGRTALDLAATNGHGDAPARFQEALEHGRVVAGNDTTAAFRVCEGGDD